VSEHIVLSFMSIAITVACVLLGIMVNALFSWRKEMIRLVETMKSDIMKEFKDFCSDNDKDHRDIWARINHHTHADDGAVTIR
jgi:hypothetical protein